MRVTRLIQIFETSDPRRKNKTVDFFGDGGDSDEEDEEELKKSKTRSFVDQSDETSQAFIKRRNKAILDELNLDADEIKELEEARNAQINKQQN